MLHLDRDLDAPPRCFRSVGRSSSRTSSFLVSAMWVTLFVSAWRTGQFQQATTDPAEQSALLDVLTSINSDVDWRTELPDACMGNQQGIYCEVDGNASDIYHVTNLEFGFVSKYNTLITCSANAYLHSSLSKLSYLQTLSIYNCFRSSSSTAIPKEIGLLSDTLQMLTMHGNPGLTGVLPVEIGNLTSLRRLVLTENSIYGSIPEELGNLSGLTQLDLSENWLQGRIPGSLNSLQSLIILDLGWNYLCGPVPSLNRLSELEKLVIGHNNLNGSIPDDLGKLSSLVYLDLSYNRLSGGIPSSLTSLGKLKDLLLDGNSMQSLPLPDFIGIMASLASLSLSKSGYVGEIPESLGKLTNLRVLSLSGNNFSGPLPSTLGGLPSIYLLDVSNNNLTGPVPFSPSFVAKLGSNLHLVNNTHLCFPPASLQEAMDDPNLHLKPCNESNSKSVYKASAPNSVLEPGYEMGKLDSNHSSRHFQYKIEIIIVMILLASMTNHYR